MPANGPPDGAIRATVMRLARPDGYGAAVVERAAIVAEGQSAGEIERWIVAHGGEPEAPLIAARPGRYGLRPDESLLMVARPPRRYVLPAALLAES